MKWFAGVLISAEVLALLLVPWIPFVNTKSLWLGVPSAVAWIAIWSLLTTPILLVASRAIPTGGADSAAAAESTQKTAGGMS